MIEAAELALIGVAVAGSYAFIRRAVSAEVRALEKKVGVLERKVETLDERNDQQDRLMMQFRMQVRALIPLLRRIVTDMRGGRSPEDLAHELDEVAAELDKIAQD